MSAPWPADETISASAWQAAVDQIDRLAESGDDAEYHYSHPTDAAKTWCGCSSKDCTIGDPEPRPAGITIDCLVCVDLRATYGISGWLALRDGAA